MPLFDRMGSIQRALKEKQAYVDARPQRVAEWVDRLNALYDRLDACLSEEVAQGLCKLCRTTKSAKSEDLGTYEEPGFAISIEDVAYVISSARRAGPMNPDTVELRGIDGKWHVRLFHVPDPAGTLQGCGASAEHASYLDKMPTAWLTPEVYRTAIERFFPYWQS